MIILSNGDEEQLQRTLASIPEASDREIIVATDRNHAVAQAQGEWIHFIHSGVAWRKDYERHLRHLLNDPEVQVFSGPLLPRKDLSFFSRSLFLALSSPLGSGPYFPRYRPIGQSAQRSQYTRLSYRNLWIRRHLLEGENPFPAEYQESSVDVFLQRLEARGVVMSYDPELWVTQGLDAHFLRLRKKLVQRGKEGSQFLRESFTGFGSLHVLPTLFVLSHGLWPLYPELFWPAFRTYYSLLLLISLGLSFRARRPWLFPLVFFYQYFLLWEYGWGFLFERLSQKWKTWNR